MPTEEELLANKKLINVSNLVQYTKGLKNYLDVSLNKKQDVLVNGQNIAKLQINADNFSLIGNSSIDLTDSIAKTITRNFLNLYTFFSSCLFIIFPFKFIVCFSLTFTNSNYFC